MDRLHLNSFNGNHATSHGHAHEGRAIEEYKRYANVSETGGVGNTYQRPIGRVFFRWCRVCWTPGGGPCLSRCCLSLYLFMFCVLICDPFYTSCAVRCIGVPRFLHEMPLLFLYFLINFTIVIDVEFS